MKRDVCSRCVCVDGVEPCECGGDKRGGVGGVEVVTMICWMVIWIVIVLVE